MPRLAEHLRGRASAIILGLVIVAATVWLRLPTWNDHILFIDEPIYYALAARLDLPGARLYIHTADQKPPLGPVTYWLALRVSARTPSR